MAHQVQAFNVTNLPWAQNNQKSLQVVLIESMAGLNLQLSRVDKWERKLPS